MSDRLMKGFSRNLLPIPPMLWRNGKPLSPEFVAEGLGLPLARVTAILDELDTHMTFLFRNTKGAVVCAYPSIARTIARKSQLPSRMDYEPEIKPASRRPVKEVLVGTPSDSR